MISLAIIFLIIGTYNAQCQVHGEIPKRKFFAQPLKNNTITIDGLINESVWWEGRWADDFIQYQPNEGKAPTQPTQFKVLYDNQYLYFAFYCKEVSKDSVINRMGRRDDFPGDWVEINIDSYHDQRSAFSFTVSASGVRGDEFISNNGENWDESWNPIWQTKTNITDSGWTAEVKIPLSQLRYDNKKEKVWGLQVQRMVFRKNERSTWQYIPQSKGAWVSEFGELYGLDNIPQHRQVEIAPYATVQIEKYKKEPGNPYAKGIDAKINGGIDGKYAVTNNLILDFTINPDFGQVEADPSQVRIDGFQNFFEERRPFFVESRNIFDYQLTGSYAGGDYDADLLFYSRRIGSSPHGFINPDENEYVKSPQNTTILGAAKFSGKTKDGWSVGVLESITEREHAIINNKGKESKALIEPLTSYGVARVQKDLDSGQTVIGGIFTAVNREKGLDDILTRQAYTGGIDFLHYWKKRAYYVRGNAIFSNISGSKQSITNVQTSFEHLFQRPNAPEFTLDSNRTSLTGSGGTFRLGKTGGKSGKHGEVFLFETGVTYRSPELELNDIGFMLTTNEINHFTWASVQYQKTIGIFRSIRFNYNHWLRWDFSGKSLYKQWNTNAHAQFLNNWETGLGITWNPYDISNNALRGAGDIRRPAALGGFWYINTDNRKKVFANIEYNGFTGFDNAIHFYDLTLQLNYVPIKALTVGIAVENGYNFRRRDQFVENITYNNATKTIVSQVKQRTLRFTGRLNYNITPDLTIQYYGQPYLTRPRYSNFSLVVNPLAKKLDDRFLAFTNDQLSFSNNVYAIDENKDGITDYSFSNPDFNFVQFRSNLVLRWEYRPGSEFYLVWSQGNTPDAFADIDKPVLRNLFNNAFAGEARNIFLVKFMYRFLK